ncbi:GAF domain-containing protein [Haloarcula litorea]|uniref:GAF domain-containing protein n=1 Tax=Haloarcula litorea TaxID=3032579 RepID=UPI0023E80FF9|nr:GAF domain-containing protein [Halomicroarcula sp. GDY20]
MTPASDTVTVLAVGAGSALGTTVAQALERADDDAEVVTVPTAAEVLARLDDGGVDCVVSAYELPEADGIALLEAVREDYPDLPFVIYTDAGSEAVASEAISAGVTDYLRREADTDDHALLAKRIGNAVGRTRAERARQRHLDAIETAQEGISILDEDGHFVYVNDAYADLYGYDPDDILGEHWGLLYRDEDVADITDEILPLVEARGRWHGRTTGVRADGTTFVEDHTLATTDTGELVCTVRDASDAPRHEEAIEALHSTARAFIGAETVDAVGEIAVEAVRDIVGLPIAGFYRYDADADALVPVTSTASADDFVGTPPPTFERGEGIAWDVYESGEPRVYDDVRTDPDRYNERTPVRSELVLPLGDHGVLLVGSEETDAFDETDVSLARTVTAHATATLTRLDRERELAAERAFVAQSLDALPDLFYVVNTDGKICRWNDRLLEVTGCDPDADGALFIDDVLADEDLDRAHDAMQRGLETGEVSTEARIRTADGDLVPYQFTGAHLTDTEGQVVGLVGVGRDISDLAEHERRLKELHSFATDLPSCGSVEAICERTVRAAETVLSFDNSALSIERDGVLEVAAVSAELPTDGSTAIPDDERLAGATYQTGESHLVDDLTAHPHADPVGDYRSAISVPVGDHGVFQTVADGPAAFDDRDLELAELLVSHAATALSRLDRERELRRQNERLDEFVSIVSHDLRNPLNVAEGHLELARRDGDLDRLDAVDRAHDRMDELIGDLLTLARQGEAAGSVETVPLPSVVEECWATVETDGARLRVETDQSVRADCARLRQLFENLFRNAVEHGSTGSSDAREAAVEITVGGLPDGFYVADDGPGVPEGERDRIFESGYSTREEGTGFGLKIVSEIADAHGWAVDVTESAAGGARFEITGVDVAEE